MTRAMVMHPMDQVGIHIEGAVAAERFIAGLQKYLCTGVELAELLSLACAMPVSRREPWTRGFAATLQKYCQRAVDIAP